MFHQKRMIITIQTFERGLMVIVSLMINDVMGFAKKGPEPKKKADLQGFKESTANEQDEVS